MEHTKQKRRLVFMGTASFAVPVLKGLLKALAEESLDMELVAVYTRPDKEKGRGLKKNPEPVKKFLLEAQQVDGRVADIPLFQPVSWKEAEVLNQLRALKADVAVVCAYGLLLPQAALDILPLGFLNIHPSLLSKYRGPTPMQAAILNQDQETGVTLMRLDAGMDTGDILAQSKIVLTAETTYTQLEQEAAEKGLELLLTFLPDYLAGKLESRPQEETQATYTQLLKKEDGLIKWREPAVKIVARVRALEIWPGSYTFFKDPGDGAKKKLAVKKALADKEEITGSVGEIMINKNKEVRVKTGEGSLILEMVQPEGKNTMAARDFMNGKPGLKELG